MISWIELDEYKTSAEIAERLKAAGIRGRHHDEQECPLAKATGWTVRAFYRTTSGSAPYFRRANTSAERKFIIEFDQGMYPDLEEEEQECQFNK